MQTKIETTPKASPVTRKKLGEMLVDSGLLTEDKLKEALTEQKGSGLKLGQYFIQKGKFTEIQIVECLCKQLRIKRYSPGKYPIEISLREIIPYETAQKYQVAPLEKKGRLLTIAMTDPLYIDTWDHIEVTTASEVIAVVCTETELANLHNLLYTNQVGLDGFIKKLNIDESVDIQKASTNTDNDELSISMQTNVDVESPIVVRLANSILSNAINERVSDIHISPQRNTVQVRFRIDGKLFDKPAPPKHVFLALLARIKILAGMDITISRIPQDGRFSLKVGHKIINVRASTVPTVHGENIVMRILDTSSGILTLEGLGMAKANVDKIKQVIRQPYGMILSTGPTGSGKTSSLYAILQELNTPDINIITLEDPVEYRIDSIRQIQLNTKAGMDFATGLRAVLRQDPDVIMVGEIRDGETASIATRAAQTGHRVLSTIHTNDAAGAVARLIDMGIEPFLISSVLLVSFAQRLIRKVCSHCVTPYTPHEKALIAWGLDTAENATFMRGKGCHQCANTGYKGRTGIFEVLVNDENMQDMIMKKASSKEMTDTAVASGNLVTLQQHAAHIVAKGLTTLEEAQAMVMN